jgi:conjugal transfer/entry exclusion protein
MSKISESELREINELRTSLSTAVATAGQATLQINLLKKDIALLEEQVQNTTKVFTSLLEKEEELVKRLSEKYGTGSIDFETGELTPET